MEEKERWWTRKRVDRSVDGVDESGRAEERMVGRSVAGAARAGSRGVGTSLFLFAQSTLLSTLLSTISSSTESTALFAPPTHSSTTLICSW